MADKHDIKRHFVGFQRRLCRRRQMKGVVGGSLILALSVASFAACAGEEKSGQTGPDKKAVAQLAVRSASKAVRLTDAQLDEVTAGTASVFSEPGILVVINPGRASVFKFDL